MKTRFLLLLSFVFSSISICGAQHRVSTVSTEEVKVSKSTENTKASRGGLLISAGVNLANLSGSDADSKAGLSFSMGYTGSVDGGYIGTYTANYTRGGYKFDYSGTDIKANLDYVGWQSKFLFRTFGDLYLGFGFGMNFLISSKYSYDGEKMDIDDVNTIDMPIPISARYYIGKNNSIFLDASYEIGLFPVVGDGFMGDNCNRGFIFSLGIKL